MTELDLLFQTAPFFATFAIGLIGGWAIVKKRISAIRKLIDSVDDALYDDKVDEKEFRNIWQNFQTVVNPK